MAKADSIEVSEQAGVRYLHFGSEWIQGAMRLSRPNALELAYTRDFMSALLLRPDAKRFLLIGLGAGSIAKFIYCHVPESLMTVVEINPRVPQIAREFFSLPENGDRLDLVVNDGACYVQETTAQFDIIFVDGFDRHARVGALDTLGFYQACRGRLSNDGLIAVNLFGRTRRFDASINRIAQIFDHRIVVLPPSDGGNVIAFGFSGGRVELSERELKAEVRALREDTGLNLSGIIKDLIGVDSI
ncbi:MAG: fused MFS/spermidine synthase [Burkholderiales bacterium]